MDLDDVGVLDRVRALRRRQRALHLLRVVAIFQAHYLEREGLPGVQVRHLEDLSMQACANEPRDAVLVKHAAKRERRTFVHRAHAFRFPTAATVAHKALVISSASTAETT